MLNTLGGLHVLSSALPLLDKDPSTTPMYMYPFGMLLISSLPNSRDSSQRNTCFGEKERREMGGVVLVIIIVASLLMGCTYLGLAQKESKVMHVGGKVKDY